MSRGALPIVDGVLYSSDEGFNFLRKEAADLTSQHFCKKRTLFNPVYISDVCVNDCVYCGYRNSNRDFSRTTLTTEQVLAEVEFVLSRGVRKILLLAGEYGRRAYVQMLLRAISAIKTKFPDVWLGLESAPLEEEDYQLFNKAGLDGVILFQETYSRQVYKKYHGSVGPKSNYDYRRGGLVRAVRGGISEVGFGVLFGLSDPATEVLEMHRHASEISELNPEIKMRFSFPRIQVAIGQTEHDYTRVSKNLLKKLIVATRLAFPESRIVLTARETQAFRLGLLDIATDIGEAGSTVVGGYTINRNTSSLSQFELPGTGLLSSLRYISKSNGFRLE